MCRPPIPPVVVVSLLVPAACRDPGVTLTHARVVGVGGEVSLRCPRAMRVHIWSGIQRIDRRVCGDVFWTRFGPCVSRETSEVARDDRASVTRRVARGSGVRCVEFPVSRVISHRKPVSTLSSGCVANPGWEGRGLISTREDRRIPLSRTGPTVLTETRMREDLATAGRGRIEGS